MMGIDPTYISAGDYKTEGNPDEPLSTEAKAAFQAQVDDFYAMFVGDVAAGRGVDTAAVESKFGQGRMVLAEQAVANGMADRVGTFEDVVAELGGGAVARRGTPGLHAGDAQTPNDVRAALGLAPVDPPRALAVPTHDTEVIDEPWSQADQEAQLKAPITGEVARAMYAWWDENAPDPDNDGWPDDASAYMFPHHVVDGSGQPGAANLRAVRTALSNVDASKIPELDKTGVKAHLQHHLDAYNAPAPADEATAEGSRRQLADLLFA
jgi:hypothetical protein